MKRFRATVTFADDSVQRITLLAKDRDDAARQVERQHFRRQERGELTFARLDEAAETGKPGMIAVDPRLAGEALTEAWVKAERERRKRDLDRYEHKVKSTRIEELA